MTRSILFILFSLYQLCSFAQADIFSYQLALRGADGNPPAQGTNIALRISILDGSATGGQLYREIHNQALNNNAGIVNIQVGNGTAKEGDIATIIWSTTRFIKTEVDLAGGVNYIDMGATQILGVPFANTAKKVVEKQTLSYAPYQHTGWYLDTIKISGGNSIVLPEGYWKRYAGVYTLDLRSPNGSGASISDSFDSDAQGALEMHWGGTQFENNGIAASLMKASPTGHHAAMYARNKATNGVGFAVHGIHESSGTGLRGDALGALGRGVHGKVASTGYGVFGEASGPGIGVYGESHASGGVAIMGSSVNGIAIKGVTNANNLYGVEGQSTLGYGLFGHGVTGVLGYGGGFYGGAFYGKQAGIKAVAGISTANLTTNDTTALEIDGFIKVAASTPDRRTAFQTTPISSASAFLPLSYPNQKQSDIVIYNVVSNGAAIPANRLTWDTGNNWWTVEGNTLFNAGTRLNVLIIRQ